MSKTVADVLREAKELLSEDKGRQLRPVVRRICGLDRDLLDMCNHALAKCGLSDNELIDRAIALASGTAEKPLGEVLAGLCNREGFYQLRIEKDDDGKFEVEIYHTQDESYDAYVSYADTPDAAVRALAEKVNV